ncbi:putative lactoylglutathione lyase [Paenibacillus shirakamiensis]|uniref:Lactoylglutathione lyase n=1 Tax=Paenibacillus shirakamiensis TaxID=1265935 RepID=A0ABS4JGW7_9BACL|nr:VOC family protein [Paenibacillus shirakamiensis]MBP2000970.1 putative lactoylglutathione lyase [Paenibacillus shirakamiensis]
MVPQRVTLITLGAQSVPKLRSFYSALGWEETPASSDDYSVFTTAGVLLSLYPYQDLLKDTNLDPGVHGQPSLTFSGITLAINVESAEEVDAVMASVKKHGAQILREPFEAVWGGRVGYFSDPEHHVWEVAYNPAAIFDESGAMISF